MRVYWYLLLGTFSILASACKTPYFPLDNYKRIYAAEVYMGHEVKQVTEGYYQLDIYEVDTIYARKRIKNYTTRPNVSNAEVIKSLHIYFIDEMRFIYSEKKFDSLDVKKDVGGKKDKLGLYKIYAQDRSEGDSIQQDYFVELAFAKSRVSNATKYTYAVIDMKLSGNNDSLDFVSADYPLSSRPRKNSTTDSIPFSTKILEEDLQKMQKSKLLHYNSSEMQFHAQWVFIAKPVPTLIDGKPYNRILYQNVLRNSAEMIRTYRLDSDQVHQENIHEDRTKNNLLTW